MTPSLSLDLSMKPSCCVVCVIIPLILKIAWCDRTRKYLNGNEYFLFIPKFVIVFFLNFTIHSAVFTWSNLLVVVVELDGNENEALDLVPMVTNVVLEEHHIIVGVVVVVDPGVVPINSRGEKQRMHLRDGFLADQLDPIYVAYNMWSDLLFHIDPSQFYIYL